MLKAFVEAISGLAVRANETKILRDPAFPRSAYLCHNGLLEEKILPAPLLASSVETFEALFAAIETFSDGPASVWHHRGAVVAMLDNADRLEGVEMPLRYSEQFQSLLSLPQVFDQKALVLFLKRNLAGAIDNTLVSLFRQIDFNKREEGKATVNHGDESLGRAVHAAVTASKDIPEFITATVMVYSNDDARLPVAIRLSVDIDVQRCTIQLTPLPDEIENAILATQTSIGVRLLDLAPENVTVFYGVPTVQASAYPAVDCPPSDSCPTEESIGSMFADAYRNAQTNPRRK